MHGGSLSGRAGNAFSRVVDACGDLMCGVRTGGFHSAAELGHRSQDCYDYAAVPYLALRAMIAAIPPAVPRATFVDYGCGLGRVLVAARRAGFSRVIGVELAEKLVEDGRRNMHHYTGWEIVHSDAADFEIPGDASVFFFGNPFGGAHLGGTLERIRESLRLRPRPHAIIGYYNVDRMKAAADQVNLSLRRLREGFYAPAAKSWAIWTLEDADDRPR